VGTGAGAFITRRGGDGVEARRRAASTPSTLIYFYASARHRRVSFARRKRRAFELLGFDAYDERMADGLQVLRYNNSNGYAAHKDYLDRPPGVSREAITPALGGANRLATVFLYLSDVQHGGQTVFPLSPRPAEASSLEALESRPLDAHVMKLRDEIDKTGSWEPGLIDDCYTKLAAFPKKGRAILFYSQHPDGSLDRMATHGGCPVLEGTKWASNLWIWNKAMPFGSSRFQAKDDAGAAAGVDVDVTTAAAPADVFWVGASEEAPMGTVTPGYTLKLHSFAGHTFVARRNSVEVARFVVGTELPQVWTVP
jgi:prolyl 4-hydroxylase